MSLLIESIDDETASRYYNEIDTASGEELANRVAALKKWADAKEADTRRQNWDHISGVFTNFDAYAASEGLTDFDEESRYQYANRKFVADQTGATPQDQMLLYPSKRDEVTDRLAGKTGLSEKETFDLFKGFVESRNATEAAIRELPGVLAQGVLARAAEGKPFDKVDSWNAFSAWKDRHADKLAGLPDGWESAMLDSAVRLHTRTEQLMDDVAPESKRAMDILLKFTRPEDAADLPEAGRAEVENLAKEFATLTPEQREGIYSTLFYAAEAGGAGMGKGFFEKVGEGLARGGTNIYDDAAITAEDRNARENLKRLRSGEPVYLGPNNLVRREDEFFQIGAAEQGAPLDESAPAGTPLAEGQIALLIESNEQRLKELRVMRELRDIAQGAIDPIKAEMDGVLGSVVQGAYDFSQSAAYTGLAMIPYVGLPAVMGALANSNYLRMIDQYPDMDADAAWTMSLAIAGPQAVVERFQANALIGRSPMLNALMRRMTDVRLPIPVRLGIGYGANVAFQTGQEFVQEAMPVIADQIAAAIREDMPQFDAKKAWGSYLDQGPQIFYSMLWAGLIGTGASTFRELKRNGQFERSLEELEMVGITGEAAQDIAAEQDPDAATAKFREAWNNRKPGDIQAGIRKRAAQLEAAQQQQPDQELPSRRVVENPDGTTTHIIEKGDGTAIYRTNDPVAADMALVNITRMMQRGRITDTTTGIVESLQFIDQVNQSLARGEDVQQLLIEGAPRTLLDEYEANPTQQNLDNLFATVRAFGQEIKEPAELAQYPVLASNRGALAEGIYKSVIRIQDGATGVEVMRDFSQDNLKRALAENRITLDWVRGQLNQVIPLIESDRLEGRRLRTETDTDVIESFSDVAVAYMTGRIKDEQIPGGLRGFLRRIAIVVRDIFRRAYRLNRAIAEGKVDASFESLLAESVGLDQQAIVDTTRDRIGNEVLADTNFSIGSPEFQNWFGDSKAVDPDGKPLVVYHGTQRPDRVGTRFRKTRATSGPMAFFTNDPDIASSYATGKKDTSMEMPSDYAGWFKWKGKGMRSPVNIDQAWWNLSEPERATIKERIYTVGYSDADEASGPIVADSQSIMSRDSIDYELRQARGNAIRALVEMWLSSGSLFNQEEKFLEVLQAAGVKGATLDDPNATRSAVYPVYLSIKNPLDTASIPENVVAALEQASKGKRAKGAIGGNPDAWDKNTISGKDWMAALKEDIANGTTYAWTRIPDWVAQTLSSLGYDGIKDTGGKRGGTAHQVWIPFNETQIKSATGNRGTFDPTSPNINYSIGFAPNGKPSNLKPEDQALARSPEFKARFGDWEALEYQTRIEKFILDALDGKKDQEEIPLRKVTAQEVNEVMRQGGPNISGMEHVLDAAHIRHALKSHSSPDEGAKQSGQRPLTQNDLMRIPEIINSYDSLRVKKAGTNRTSIIYGKSYQDGTINYIERVFETSKRNKPRLITKTVWAVTEAGVKSNSTRVYTPDRDPTLPLANGRVNPESVSVKTDENGEPLASEIARFRKETGTSNFSIATPRDIQRVSRAFDAAARSPDERIAIFERAKGRFFSVLAENQKALDDLRGGTLSFRRTQLLQALGELDAILSVFPPDIRGKVGGYTKLASIAPHDVFDPDNIKIAEVSGMKGAIISAWMRTGLNIGEANKKTELPPGFTAKENLSTARADRAIAEFFKNRVEVLDRELEKTLRREYDQAFQKLLDRTKPKKAKPGEKPKGIGADVQDLFAVVREAVEMNATDVAAHIAGLDSKIASGELTAEQEARAQVEAALVSLVGDWKNASADRRKSAFMEASRIWNGAYAAHAQKVIAQRQQREVARLDAVVATGKAGDMSGRKAKAIRDSGLKGTWKDFFLNLLNFDQVAGVLFGENSEVANTMIDAQRKAENAKEDGSQAKMQELEDFFTQLAGGNLLDGEKLRYELAQPSMMVQNIKLSQLEGLSAVMMWAQEDGRRHMEGELDELGRPAGAWHYNQAFVDEILNNLSDEALALRSWLLRNYASEYAKINEVYSELNGVNLPQIQFYSPITVQPLSAPTGQVLDPVSGSAMSGASTSPGALRTRGTAIAEPRFQDALQTYISHTLQMEHWKAFAPFVAEANGILRNRDVQNSVEEKGGAEARKVLNAWLDYFAQGGTRDAGAHLAINQVLTKGLGRLQQAALVGRISTLIIQSTQLGAALAEMPVKAYLKRMGKLLTGQLGWTDALNSDYIQRRIRQMPPVVQMAMEGFKSAKPSAIQQAGKRLGMLLSGADGLFTAGTYAITYDYHLSKANELGLTGQEAETYARNIAERVTDRIAQPTRAGARSLYENTSTNPLARAAWAFASEARKNLAISAYSFAADRGLATKLQTLTYVIVLNAIGSQILRSIWRDILDDEDDELFDEKYWSPKRIAMSVATEPFYGLPVVGTMLEDAVYKSAGEYLPQGSLFSVSSAVGPIKRLPDHLSGDTEMRDVMRDLDMFVSALAILHPDLAATSSITHLARDLFNIADSAVDAATNE